MAKSIIAVRCWYLATCKHCTGVISVKFMKLSLHYLAGCLKRTIILSIDKFNYNFWIKMFNICINRSFSNLNLMQFNFCILQIGRFVASSKISRSCDEKEDSLEGTERARPWNRLERRTDEPSSWTAQKVSSLSVEPSKTCCFPNQKKEFSRVSVTGSSKIQKEQTGSLARGNTDKFAMRKHATIG